MANEEECAKGCGTPVVALERKIVQVLMEVLVEEDSKEEAFRLYCSY
jgi:hypothetical protein